MSLLDLRTKAAGKFADGPRMFLNREGYEQSSGTEAARHRAAYFPPGEAVLDLCCGIGGDLIELARRGPAYGIDSSPGGAAAAHLNLEALGLVGNGRVACSDVTKLRMGTGMAVFDPSRRSGGRRTLEPDEFNPPLDFVTEILRHVPSLAVKLSPALDLRKLELARDARVEHVSVEGECREAVLWYGDVGPLAKRTATILPSGATISDDGVSPHIDFSAPQDWLYDPDPAVARSGLVPALAERFGGLMLSAADGYITSHDLHVTPFARAYRLIETTTIAPRRINEVLRSLKARCQVVKKRGVQIDPVVLLKELKSYGNREVVVVVGRIGERMFAMICDPERRTDA